MENPFLSISNRLDNIERLLIDIKHDPKPIQEVTHTGRKILTIAQAAELTHFSKSRLYILAGNGTIPNFKRGTRVMFYEDELLAWLESGRRLSPSEIDAAADQSLKIKRHA